MLAIYKLVIYCEAHSNLKWQMKLICYFVGISDEGSSFYPVDVVELPPRPRMQDEGWDLVSDGYTITDLCGEAHHQSLAHLAVSTVVDVE